VFVLNYDFGLGIISKAEPENMLNLSGAQIDEMTFKDLDNNREKILNLKSREYLFEFMEKRALPQSTGSLLMSDSFPTQCKL